MSTATLKTGEPLSAGVQALQDIENNFTTGGYGALPGYILSGKGSTLKDIDGRELIDFLCMFSAGNLGQCHPKLSNAIIHILQDVTIINMSINYAGWPELARELCSRLGYDKVASMCTGAEAADTACKFARKWGIRVKGIKPEQVLVLGTSDNYHGLTSGIWPIMDKAAQRDYGVFSASLTNVNPTTGYPLRYGHVEDFEEAFKEHSGRVAAVIMECIHGTLPTFEEELKFAIGVRKLCREYNILFISDEVRQGAGKTGKFLSCEWMGIENKPDMVAMGKSIAGGAYPASYILGNNEVMTLVKPFETVSTFASTPMAVAATWATLHIYDEENLLARALQVETSWKEATKMWEYPFIKYITSRGCDITIMIDEGVGSVTARRIARLAYQKGLLTYGRAGRMRIGLALTITDKELHEGIRILKETFDEIESYGDIPGSTYDADT